MPLWYSGIGHGLLPAKNLRLRSWRSLASCLSPCGDSSRLARYHRDGWWTRHEQTELIRFRRWSQQADNGPRLGDTRTATWFSKRTTLKNGTPTSELRKPMPMAASWFRSADRPHTSLPCEPARLLRAPPRICLNFET